MTTRMNRLLRAATVVFLVAFFVGGDLISKRWMEENLADWSHMLAVGTDVAPSAATVGDLVRKRFPDMPDSALKGSVVRLPDRLDVKPGDKVHALESKVGTTIEGFAVYDQDFRFVRRVPRMDSVAVRRLVSRAMPDADPAKVAEEVKIRLADMTVRDFLLDRIPAESSDTVDETVARRLFVIPAGGMEPVDPASKPVPGATYLLTDRTINIVEGFWDYSYAENPAGAFSMLLGLDAKVRRAIFLVFSIIAIIAIAFMLIRPPYSSFMVSVALGCLLGGALGNLVDRITLTYVVDFIHMYWGDYHWPRYNVADIGISVGVGLLLLVSLLNPSSAKQAKKTADR